MELKALLLTVLVGIFFLIGIYIPKFFKKKDKLILFTTSLAFVVMMFILFCDLIPEINEILEPFTNLHYLILILIFVLFGFFLLKILDLFVPEHTHDHHEHDDNQKEHNNHLYHIGLITAISLIIHNMLEGISIYVAGLNDWKTGLMMALSVSCHNLPLGVQISANLEATKEKKGFKIFIFTLLIVSSFLGAFLLYVTQEELTHLMEGILLSITIGMLLYISLLELLPEIRANKSHKEIKLGLLVGVLLAFILILL